MSFNSQNAAIVKIVGSLLDPFIEKFIENVNKDDKDFIIKTKETTDTKEKEKEKEKTDTKEKDDDSSSDSSESSESEDGSEENNETDSDSDSESECDVSESSEYSESSESSECAYVLMVNNLPKACSTNYTDLSCRREELIKRHITDFSSIFGRMYVSGTTPEEEKHDTRILSYLNRNLLWTTETVLNTYTIHRVYSA